MSTASPALSDLSTDRSDDAPVSLAVIAAATTLVLVVFTTIITTVGATAASFHASVDGQTWALGGMSLGLAAALLSAGGLADIVGHRHVFIAASLALAAASALAAAAPTMLVFVVARVLEGVAGAGVLSAGLGAIGTAFPDGRARTHATGIWSAALGAGIALGPVLAAVLAAAGSWRTASAFTAIVSLATAAVGRRLPTAGRSAQRRRLDPAGALALFAGMGCLTAAITSGRTSFTSNTTIGLLVVGAVALIGFAFIEHRGAHPLLTLGLLRHRPFIVSIAGAATTGLSTIALLSYLPTLLQHGLEQTALAAGTILAIWSLTSTLISSQVSRLPERLDANLRLAAGLLFSAAGSGALALLQTGSHWWTLAPGLALAGIGSGIANAALAHVAVQSVPPRPSRPRKRRQQHRPIPRLHARDRHRHRHRPRHQPHRPHQRLETRRAHRHRPQPRRRRRHPARPRPTRPPVTTDRRRRLASCLTPHQTRVRPCRSAIGLRDDGPCDPAVWLRVCWPLVASSSTYELCDCAGRGDRGRRSPGDDPLGMDANQRSRRLDRVGATTDLDSARAPGIGAGEVVDHQRRAPALLDVAELLGLCAVVAADLDRIELGVERPAYRYDLRRSVRADRRHAGQASRASTPALTSTGESPSERSRSCSSSRNTNRPDAAPSAAAKEARTSPVS